MNRRLNGAGSAFALAGIVTLCRTCHIARHRGDRRRAPTAAEQRWHDLVADMRSLV